MPAPQELAASLLAGGLPESEIPAKLDLFLSAGRALSRLTTQPPETAWWAPGRIEVFGKHTDYAGGHSLLATMPKGFVVLGAPRSDGRVRVAAGGFQGEIAEVDPAAPEGPDSGQGAHFAPYVRALVLRLARNFPGLRLSADLAFASDLPQAAGLSSSSALTVGLASALCRLSGLDDRVDFRAAIRTVEDRAGYFACLENGADFGPFAGSPGVGALTGSEDQTAILGCRAGQLSHYSFLPIVHHGDVPFPTDWRFVIAASGVVAEKAGNARERYNRAARSVAALLEIWNREAVAQGRAPVPSLAAALTSAPFAEDSLDEGDDGGLAPEDSSFSSFSASELQTRLAHFLRENPRAAQAVVAFRKVDEEALGALGAASQRDAEELLGNQVAETATLVRLARGHGAFAASAFGGGFGGAVWALVREEPPGAAQGFAGRWLAAYRERFPRRHGAEVFVAMPGPGLLSLPLP